MIEQDHSARGVAAPKFAQVVIAAFIVLFVVAVVYPVFAPWESRDIWGPGQHNRQVALGSLMYAGDYDDGLPLTINGELSRMQNRPDGVLAINCPGPGTQDFEAPHAGGAEPSVGWPVLIMPYINSRMYFVDPSRGEKHNIWTSPPLTPGDKGYDPEGATLRNESRFPMYGYNYMFLSPLHIPKDKLGLPDAINYAIASGRKSTDAADPSGTVFFTASERSLSDTTRGFFVINAPGMWRTFANTKSGNVAFWNGTPGSGDWVGTDTACPNASFPCDKPSQSHGFVYLSHFFDHGPTGVDVTFVDGHVKYMTAQSLAAGTNYESAVAGADGSGAIITDPKHYLWDLK